VLLVVAVIALAITYASYVLLIPGLIAFSGDWEGPLTVKSGRGGIRFEVAVAWTYLVPVMACLVLGAGALLGSLIARVTLDARELSRGRR
jgi:hypothetical protein